MDCSTAHMSDLYNMSLRRDAWDINIPMLIMRMNGIERVASKSMILIDYVRNVFRMNIGDNNSSMPRDYSSLDDMCYQIGMDFVFDRDVI